MIEDDKWWLRFFFISQGSASHCYKKLCQALHDGLHHRRPLLLRKVQQAVVRDASLAVSSIKWVDRKTWSDFRWFFYHPKPKACPKFWPRATFCSEPHQALHVAEQVLGITTAWPKIMTSPLGIWKRLGWNLVVNRWNCPGRNLGLKFDTKCLRKSPRATSKEILSLGPW